MLTRCDWANSSELLKKYHDNEWGRPLYDDNKLFEMLILEIMSCGLSWEIILKKRKYIRTAFDYFCPETISNYDQEKIDNLMKDHKIVRNKQKIIATIQNAKAYLLIREKQTFSDFLWRYVNYHPVSNNTNTLITKNEISDKLSNDLKQVGFKFIGSIIIYSFMQAVGMINDHDNNCSFK